jgi:hypothetical protein
MGLRDWARKKAVAAVAGRIEREVPVIARAILWLTDPKAQGRKRGICAGAVLLSAGIRGIGSGIGTACLKGFLVGAVCSTDVGGYAEWVDLVGVFVDTVLKPGADFAAIVFGAWGLVDERRKKAEKDAYFVTLPR